MTPATLAVVADDDRDDQDDPPDLEYPNELARRAAKAAGAKTHRPAPEAPAPS